ncbi:SDR family NAD(P)-dependent oxidoreductase [Paraburkholderia sp. BR14374]|uniref:SDR family NAD(P)-dependent oxidoreductase n=1 Tax=Paraburkholderia sp. BR14374 TaxID=3237007 RepID=UPI0034CEB760
MGRIEGKVIIVTGAARGQGEATARLFVEQGARVVLTDVLASEGHAVAEDLGERALFIKHDITEEAAWTDVVNRTLDHFGAVDGLVNNAGVTHFSRINESQTADFDRVMAINVRGSWLGMKAVSQAMIPKRKGAIVNIASINGLRGSLGMTIYDASKWAMRGMTKSAALDLAGHGIRVNSVHPGAVDTPMINPERDLDTKEMAQNFSIPLGRVGFPIDVAQASLFLISDEAAFITGAELAVDGGTMAGFAGDITTML